MIRNYFTIALRNLVVMLLSKDFTRLVLIGFVVAAPLAYLAMSRWLEQFAYRTSPGTGTFILAANPSSSPRVGLRLTTGPDAFADERKTLRVLN
jgi:hypothetical protein